MSRSLEARVAGLERFVMDLHAEMYPLRKMRDDLKHEVDDLKSRLDAAGATDVDEEKAP